MFEIQGPGKHIIYLYHVTYVIFNVLVYKYITKRATNIFTTPRLALIISVSLL